MKTNNEKARFDTRLPLDQKLMFEKAANLGGYRNLTDFIIMTVQEKAKEIIEENDRILSSKEDKAIFFDALFNAPEPNENLNSALNEYKDLL